MSHIVTIQTELRDLAAIKAACKRMGWEFIEGQTTFKWFGSYIGDYMAWEQHLRTLGIKPENYGKCNHAIKVPGASYEIGLVQQGSRFVPLWDTWASGRLDKITSDNGMAGFVQAYAVECAKLEARRKGYHVVERKLKDGSIKLEVQVNG